MEDFLVLQRDFEADGGLTPIPESTALALRVRAVEAVSAVLEELGLARPTTEMKASVVRASGSRETTTFSTGETARISEEIQSRGIDVIDVIGALARCGFTQEAENLLRVVKLRVSGDYLQTSSIIRAGRVLSAVNDPNDYAGPGTGYRLTSDRREAICDIRDTLGRSEVLTSQSMHRHAEARRIAYVPQGDARRGTDPHEVVIGISPGFGLQIFRTTADLNLSDVLRALMRGVEEGGALPRVLRMYHTADTSFLGLAAAQMSGSGFGIGIQAKGTAVLHQRGRMPHNNLELFSNAPITTLAHYEGIGRNAAQWTHGIRPEPVVVQTDGQALGARYHVQVALLHAIETGLTDPHRAPEEVSVRFTGPGQGA
jgi:propanediol dehydratase large subunit